ncbi:nucleotidyltransferase domain-containing protein [Pseudonocardia sp. P1]
MRPPRRGRRGAPSSTSPSACGTTSCTATSAAGRTARADPTGLDAVLAAHDVTVAYLFGSRAEGRARPDSDHDVAVLFGRDDLPLDATERLAADLAAVLGTRVDVVDLARAGLELQGRVAEAGRLLYSADDAVRVRFEVDARMRWVEVPPRRRADHAVLPRPGRPGRSALTRRIPHARRPGPWGPGRRGAVVAQGTTTGPVVGAGSSAQRCPDSRGVTPSSAQAVSSCATLLCITVRSRSNEFSGTSSTSPSSSHQAQATAPALATKSGSTGTPRAASMASASGVVAAFAASTTTRARTSNELSGVIA